MRELSGPEIIEHLAAAKARERHVMQQAAGPATDEELEAIARAEAALQLVVQDIEATTSLREPSKIQRYADWVAERQRNPLAELLAGGGDDDGAIPSADDDDDEGVVVACHWDGRAFALNADQPPVEIVIAGQLQDDVIDEVWGAWPACPGHAHPMSLDVIGGVAVWACPRDADVLVPVGQLQARHGDVQPEH